MAQQSAATTNALIVVPEHLILEHILPRLPVKTLIRFKSVSKLWHSTLSSSKFAKLRLKFSPSYSKQFIILNKTFSKNVCEYKLMLVPYDELDNNLTNLKTPIELNFRVREFVNPRLVGSCHGLLCFSNDVCPPDAYSSVHLHRRNNFLSVYNPATKESRDIAHPDSLEYMSDSWFGCTSSVDDHRIVGFFSSDIYGRSKSCYAYSFWAEDWKLISGIGRFLKYQRLSYITSPINDLLYWSPFSLKHPGSDRQPKRIVALDLGNDRVKEFPWMEWLRAYNTATFFVAKGRLSLYCVSENPTPDVWILKQHDNWSSWEKSHSITLGDSQLVYITPTGNYLVSYKCENPNPLVILSGVVRGYVETLISPYRTLEFFEAEDHQI